MGYKNYIFYIFLLCTFLVIVPCSAQQFNDLDQVPHDISYYRESRITPPLVKVLYGRPSKNGKKIFGEYVPFNEVWRTGYNEATEIKFYGDVLFGNTKIKAGNYVLLTIPGEKEWKVILNSQLDTWGAFQYDPIFNVAEISVPVKEAEELEVFSISFKKKSEEVQMILGWDSTRVFVPLKFRASQRQFAQRRDR